MSSYTVTLNLGGRVRFVMEVFLMTAFVDRLDRFVRWFFNSSPTTDRIEPIRHA